MEEYSDRRSKPEISYLRRGSRFSSRNQSSEERTNHSSDKPGSSTRFNPMKARIGDNQERPRYVRDSFKSSSSKVAPASSSKFPLSKFEERRRQPFLPGFDIAESSRRKADAKRLEGSKKIAVDNENLDTLQGESEDFTIELSYPDGSHFTGHSGVSAHAVESLVQTASLSSRTRRQKHKEVNLGTPGASSSSLTNGSNIPGNSTMCLRPAYGHVSGGQIHGLNNLGCTSVPDAEPSGCPSESVISRRFEFMRKRAFHQESSSRSRNLSLGHSPPTDIRSTGNRIRMNEQSLSQQIPRRSSRSHQESAVSVRTRRSSPHATRMSFPDERADGAQEHLSLEEVSTESSIRPFFGEFDNNIFSSSRRRCSNTRAGTGRPSSRFEESPQQMFHSLMGERDSHRHITMERITEVLVALERIEQQAELTYDQLLVLETNLFFGAFASYDRHRDMRMDIDNMSYEELLALEERIGSVSTALSDEQFTRCLRRSIYSQVAPEVNKSTVDDMKCSICQVYLRLCCVPWGQSYFLVSYARQQYPVQVLRQSIEQQYPVQVLRPSIELWLMVSLKLDGYVNFLVSFAALFIVPQLFIVATSMQFTSPPTPFSTNAPNIWRLTYTSFMNASPLEKSVSCMFLHPRNMLTSSPNGFRHQYLHSLGPVLMFAVLAVQTAGAC